MTAKEAITRIATTNGWVKTWAQTGMVVYADATGKALELKQGQQLPDSIKALGCGGWNEAGQLFWVGMDFDVGHGAISCETLEEAIAAAKTVRTFVNNAAEIRLSKSGKGVHVRIRIGEKILEGRKTAGNIAKWLAKTLDVKADPSPLGRQNFWFWCDCQNNDSFKLIENVEGWWTPPPAALKEHVDVVIAPQAPRIPSTSTDATKRAAAYIAKIPAAVSGQGGHDATFKVCLQLIKGFGLTTDEARPLIYDWNRGCQPSWSEKELEHKLRQASTSTRVPDGYKLQDRPAPVAPKSQPPKPLTANSDDKPVGIKLSDKIIAQMQDEIDGKRFAAAWPFERLSWASQALLPGTVTVFCAPGGSAKSFFLVQCARYWLARGYKTALMELEENQTFHGRRLMAQIEAQSNVTSAEWVANNPDSLDIPRKHAEEINAFGECLFEPAGRFDTVAAVRWVADCVDRGYRIIAIDPITAKDEGEKPWVDDKNFINGVKDVLKDANASLVLITHPPKNAKDTTLDNVAGGAAYQRFCQNIFYMKVQDDESVPIVRSKDPKGDTWEIINRVIYLRKLRNGRATNARIGLWFNPETLCFEERGIMRKMVDEET